MRPLDGCAAPALLGAVLFMAFSPAVADPACPAVARERAVIDRATPAGTLLTTEGREIVLAGIAVPWAGAAMTRPAGEPGLGASLSGLASGPVGLAPADRPDRYGRTRAHVYTRDGRWLQATLVTGGLAVARPNEGDGACMRALLALEAAARQARSGVWADSNTIAKASDEASLLAGNGLYGVVEGRIVSVGHGSRMVFLDFGRNFPTDFTVMVPKVLVPRLLEAGIAVDSLAGRAVRVRGVIEESGGPAIRLADPLALELLDREE